MIIEVSVNGAKQILAALRLQGDTLGEVLQDKALTQQELKEWQADSDEVEELIVEVETLIEKAEGK